MGLNPESEMLNGEARKPNVDPPLPEDQAPDPAASEEPVLNAAKEAAARSASPKKPKRKYKVSDKVRASSPANLKQARKAYVFTPAREAAAMKNLAKAHAAPPEKRNRFTERRLLARYANLCLAHLKLGPPGQRSLNHIYTGTSCRHLEHSLALAGEDKAKLEAHRDRYQRAFRPRDREERRFVRGMADTAWRLLRGLGVRGRWEMRAAQYRLLLAINWRQSGDPPGQKLEPGAARRMAERLLGDLGDVFRVYEEQKRLRKRLEELFRAFLSHRMGAPSSFHWFTSKGSRLPDFEHMPDFALSNPSLWPKLAEELAEQEAAGAKKLKEAKDWAGSGTGDGRKKGDPARPLSDEEKFLRHQILQSTGFNDALDQTGLERLLELAFGIEVESRNSKIETREDGNPSPVVDGEGGRVSNFDFRVSSSGQSSISDVAGALWKRLRLFPDWRAKQAREMDETLEQASGPQGVETWEPQPPRGRIPKSGWPREADDESPHWQWRALAALLLAVFACEIDWVDEAGVLSKRLHGAFYRFLVWHYGVALPGARRVRGPPARREIFVGMAPAGDGGSVPAGAVRARGPTGDRVQGIGNREQKAVGVGGRQWAEERQADAPSERPP